MNTVTIVIRKSLQNGEIYLHRAFENPKEAIELTQKLNEFCNRENMKMIWYSYTMVLE